MEMVRKRGGTGSDPRVCGRGSDMIDGDENTLGRIVHWILVLGWLSLPATYAGFGGAFAHRSGAVQWTGAVGLWTGWGGTLLALLVPASSTLTIARLTVPAAPVAAVATLIAGTDSLPGALALAVGVICTVAVFNGDLGERFVQASAYGAEQRLLLRPPPVWALLAGVTWSLLVTAALSGPLLLAAEQWVVGVPVSALAVLLAKGGSNRVHRLTRRWLVYVPAGLVVHDHVVLADAHLLPASDIGSVHLAYEGTEAADFTGGALGPAVEVELTSLATVTLAPTREAPRGTALHVRSFIISPTRPGRALRLARAHALPVG